VVRNASSTFPQCTVVHRNAPQWSASVPMVRKLSATAGFATCTTRTVKHHNGLQASATFSQCAATHHNGMQHTAMAQKCLAMFLQCIAMHCNGPQAFYNVPQVFRNVVQRSVTFHNASQRTLVCLSVCLLVRIWHPGKTATWIGTRLSAAFLCIVAKRYVLAKNCLKE